MKQTRFFSKWKLLLWSIISTFMLASQSGAQTGGVRRITGKVLNATSQPVAGVTVSIKGSNVATSTNAAGTFTINAKSSDVLVVTSIGFGTKESRVGSGSVVNFSIAEEAGKMDEVVVVGYGRMRRAEQTSAQTTISSADINRTVNTTLDQALQGRAAGVYVTQNSGQPGGGISVAIRGISTLSGSTQPLYVIDGVQLQSADVNYGATASSNPLSFLNPSDIESMEILQGPSATAIYGSRGTNGVVLITTKRGKAGQLRVNYNYLTSLQDKPKELATMNLPQYAQMENELRRLQNGGVGRPQFADSSILGPGTNWQDALFKTAPLQKHQLSVSGGNSGTTFYFSAEYLKQEGVSIGSDFNRGSVRLNLDNNSLNWLKLSTSLSFSQTKEKLGATSENVISNAITMAPNVAVKNALGGWGGADATNGNSVQFTPLNPVAIANLIQNNLTRSNAIGAFSVDINLIKGLTFRTSISANANWSNGRFFTPTYQLGEKTNSTSSLSLNSNNSTYYNLNELLQYNTKIGKHSIGLMASHEAQENRYSGLSGSRTGFTSNEVVSFALGSSLGQQNGNYQGSFAMESYLGRVNYTYDNKYILQGSIRADGSIYFAPGNRWGKFPSASAAWRVSEESFMKEIPFINELKIRFETGLTGNQGTAQGYYAPLATNSTPWGAGFLVNSFANPQLKWESTNTNNIGFNLSVLKNRVQIEGDYYIKKTSNLLMVLPEPGYMGTSGTGSIRAPFVNIGALQNNGYAFTINTVNISKPGFTWRSNFNVSHFNTKINKFYSNSAVVDRQPWYIGTGSDAAHGFLERSAVGQAPWLMYGYIQEGLFQSVGEINKSAVPTKSDGKTRLDTDPGGVWVGDIKYKDLDGNGIIDFRDQTIIGNPWPKFTYGFTNTFSYKGFDLSVLFTSSMGNDVFNFLRFVNTNPNNINLGRNLLAETFDYAKLSGSGANTVLSNPGTVIPRISNGDPNGNAGRITNAFIEDGSYVKLKNITLTYNLPKQVLSRLRVVQGARLSIGAQNLLTFTKYKGFDPEVGAYVGQNVGSGDQLQGVDAGRYPLTRTYTFNLGIDF